MDRVIHCPGDIHKKPRLDKKTGTLITTPRILMIVGEDSSGEIQVQCHDSSCKRTSNNRGWYRILMKNGRIVVKPIVSRNFEITQYPVAVLDAD